MSRGPSGRFHSGARMFGGTSTRRSEESPSTSSTVATKRNGTARSTRAIATAKVAGAVAVQRVAIPSMS